MWPRPVICFVTDRHRLAERLALDPAGDDVLERLAGLVGVAADAGVDLVQVREADLDAQLLADYVRRLVERVRDSRTRIVVNDRFDVALAAGAQGVHLKDAPVSVERIRAAAPEGFLIGQSIHSPAGAAHSSADYLIFGTVFPSRSKPDLPAGAGLAGLEAAANRARVPVLGIGGVNRTHFSAIAATGAAGIAAIDLFLPSRPAVGVALHDIVAEARRTFDSAKASS
jgi:thiamine-phosphate pyrophosphorylase